MNYKLSVKVEQEGKSGSVHVAFDDHKFQWYWEFATGKYIAFIKVPTLNEWKEMAVKQYDRDSVLSEVAKEVCKLKGLKCKFEIYFDSIGIIRSNT